MVPELRNLAGVEQIEGIPVSEVYERLSRPGVEAITIPAKTRDYHLSISVSGRWYVLRDAVPGGFEIVGTLSYAKGIDAELLIRPSQLSRSA